MLGSSALVVSAAALGNLLSVVSAATLDRHGCFVVSAPTLSVVASTTLLGSSRAVISASSDGHCDCDGGWDDKNKEINFDLGSGFGLWDASDMGVAVLQG